MKLPLRELLFSLLLCPTLSLGQGVSGGGQTKDNPSAWTIDSLKAHVDEMMGEADKRYDQRFQAQLQALQKSDAATEKRFESVNEFRNQLRDQNQTFMLRTEALSRIDANATRLDALAKAISDKEATSNGSTQVWGLMAAILVLFCTVIGMIVAVGGFIFVVITRRRPHVAA